MRKIASPFHTYRSAFTLMDTWRYCVFYNNITKTVQPLLFSPWLFFITPLPLSHLVSTHPYAPLHTFHPSFHSTSQLWYLAQETWRQTATKIVWAATNLKTFMKVRFRGKGYYLYKSRRNTLSFRFGYSHRVYRYSGIMWFKLMSKTEIFIWGRSMSQVWRFAWSIKRIRPHNQYTGKGIRFLRQITYRKLGKIGSYR